MILPSQRSLRDWCRPCPPLLILCSSEGRRGSGRLESPFRSISYHCNESIKTHFQLSSFVKLPPIEITVLHFRPRWTLLYDLNGCCCHCVFQHFKRGWVEKGIIVCQQFVTINQLLTDKKLWDAIDLQPCSWFFCSGRALMMPFQKYRKLSPCICRWGAFLIVLMLSSFVKLPQF